MRFFFNMLVTASLDGGKFTSNMVITPVIGRFNQSPSHFAELLRSWGKASRRKPRVFLQVTEISGDPCMNCYRLVLLQHAPPQEDSVSYQLPSWLIWPASRNLAKMQQFKFPTKFFEPDERFYTLAILRRVLVDAKKA